MSRSYPIRFEIIFQINDLDKVTDWDILVHTLGLGSFIERFGFKKLQHEIWMGLDKLKTRQRKIWKTFKHSVQVTVGIHLCSCVHIIYILLLKTNTYCKQFLAATGGGLRNSFPSNRCLILARTPEAKETTHPPPQWDVEKLHTHWNISVCCLGMKNVGKTTFFPIKLRQSLQFSTFHPRRAKIHSQYA